MRSLNKSLPKTKRQPDIHQTFRTAALTVTNLYKDALADLDRSRSDGYQEAIEELLGFLDKENIGTGIGEGWRIRQWAAERLEGTPKQPASDSEEDELDDKRARSSSPIMEHSIVLEDPRTSGSIVGAAHRSDSAPPPVQTEATTVDADTSPLNHVFQFSGTHTYPSNNNNNIDATAVSDFTSAARRAFPNPRRTSNRPSQRNLHRSAAQNAALQLGHGAGQKRRLMQDFFNVDGFNDRRDGSSGGPKRGRMG